jgi:toxin ParE1/3/4
MLPVIYRPAAEFELQDAYRWYEERERGLGSEFIQCIDACVETICRHPEIYPIAHREIRQGVVRRFPFTIYYVPTKDAIIILSVFHSSREPLKRQRPDLSA